MEGDSVRSLLSAVVMLTLAGTANAQFLIDQTPKDLRKAVGKMAIEDLAIEETGLIVASEFCTDNDGLSVVKSAALASEKTNYGLNFRVTRKQGDTVTLEVAPGAEVKSFRTTLLEMILRLQHVRCETFGISTDQRFVIQSINGYTRLSDLAKSLGN